MTSDYSLLSNRQIVALTIWGEARGEPVEGQLAVGCVIRNRVRNGAGWSAVCLAPMQFSCFNADSQERSAMLSVCQTLSHESELAAQGVALSPVLRQCLWLADGIIDGSALDVTHGATHYLTCAIYATFPPKWAQNTPVLDTIGQHVFLKAA